VTKVDGLRQEVIGRESVRMRSLVIAVALMHYKALMSGATKYRIGRIGHSLRQGKPKHRTDQDIVPTPRVGVRVTAGVGDWGYGWS